MFFFLNDTFYILIISLCILEEDSNSKEAFLLLNENDLNAIGFTTIGRKRLILNKIAEINNNRGNYRLCLLQSIIFLLFHNSTKFFDIILFQILDIFFPILYSSKIILLRSYFTTILLGLLYTTNDKTRLLHNNRI